jgi:lipoprotein NlpD
MVGQSKVDASAVPATTVASTITGPSHTVKKGDTLYSIALDNGVYYKDLQSWNSLDDPNRILIGQQLRLSPPEGSAVAKPLQAGSPVAASQTRPLVEERPLSPAGTHAPLSKLLTEPKVAKQPYSAEAYARLQRQGNPLATKSAPAAAVPEAPKVVADTGSWIWPANGKVLGGFGEAGGKGVDIAGNAGDPVKAVAEGKVVYVGTGLRGYGQMVIVKHDSTYLTAYAHNQKLLVTEGQSVTQGQKIAEMGSSDSDRVKLHFEVRKLGKPVDPSGYLPR